MNQFAGQGIYCPQKFKKNLRFTFFVKKIFFFIDYVINCCNSSNSELKYHLTPPPIFQYQSFFIIPRFLDLKVEMCTFILKKKYSSQYCFSSLDEQLCKLWQNCDGKMRVKNTLFKLFYCCFGRTASHFQSLTSKYMVYLSGFSYIENCSVNSTCKLSRK